MDVPLSGGMKRPRVVVVDDVDDIRELTTLYLQDHGYDVVTAQDGREAIERVLEHVPFAVLMDLAMPGFDGCDALRELKSTPATREIPVVIVTANTAAHHVRAAWDAGADAVLEKPVDPPRLLEILLLLYQGAEIPHRFSVVPRH